MRATHPLPEVSSQNISRTVKIAGHQVDISIKGVVDHSKTSAHAARLAEDLVAIHIGCERRLVRVATLMPSGRPVAIVLGKAIDHSLSLSHIDRLFGAAICATSAVGLDIVDPALAGRSLDVWFTPEELTQISDERGHQRAKLWSAKEAAFKAAKLDEGFRPCAVEIKNLSLESYQWTVNGHHGTVSGHGLHTFSGSFLVALAVATERRAISEWPYSS